MISPNKRAGVVADLQSNSLYIERIIPLLITGGIFVHLVNIGNYLRHGEARIGDVLHPVVDAPLAVMMIYSAIGLIHWRHFFEKFGIASAWRKAGYALIAFYIIASIPGHVSFLASGDKRYFEFFPWWFSVVLMPIYALMIVYFVTLQPRAGRNTHG